MGTFLNHALKSSEGPTVWLKFFSLTGSAFALYEGCNPVPGYKTLNKQQTYEAVIREADRLGVIQRLTAYSVTANSITNDRKGGSYHIVILKPDEKTVSIESFGRRNLNEANQQYSMYEKMIEKGSDMQVVLVATGSIDSLRQAYPNYFLDTREFILALVKIHCAVEDMENNQGAQSFG